MLFKSNKIFYTAQDQDQCKSWFRKIDEKTIAVSDSVAYPEGGGQLCDIGTITQNNICIPFTDCQIDGEEIRITLAEPIPESFDDTKEILMSIDRERREALTISHSASHLMFIAIDEIRPGASEKTHGCQIREKDGRFDFQVEKFFPEDLSYIENRVAEMVAADRPIRIELDPKDPSRRFWAMDQHRMPCGGTHANRSGVLGKIKLSRKSQGKKGERLYYRLDA